ncbi:hypothetical protein AVEN_60026-1 [Araneus ventricosus]|uniref:Uncharacterized protein n=1 Tax=Araneus ventricosus TaxID=182803 RepID=A0A4Y2CB82_ARAVE|nr:hypothetical protein AVEN_60026-1 [Araneus ventricosus]
MDVVGEVLENDMSTALIENFPKITDSEDLLEKTSPLPSSSNKDRKRKNSFQLKRSKLFTPRTSKEDLKMKIFDLIRLPLSYDSQQSEIPRLNNLPYSPDLAPIDIFPLPKLNLVLEKIGFQNFLEYPEMRDSLSLT